MMSSTPSGDEEVPRMTEAPWLPYTELTEADLALLPDDGHRYEIVDGSLVVSPPPSSAHQVIAARVTDLLRRHATAGVEVLEGVGVRVGRSMLVPDVAVVSGAVALRDVAAFEAGDVLLVVEIVSRSSVTMDRITKPALLAAAGVPSYWRVERDHPGGVLLAVHELASGAYRLVGEVVGEAEAVIERPFPARFRPADLNRRR
jgi:Uma2 family endonuclease